MDGFVYTAFCVDVFSRRILGWRVMTTKTTLLVSATLEQALFTRKRADFCFAVTGLVHHSDAGSRYTSRVFVNALTESGIAGSIGSVGDALDNALMESTVGLYKTELIDRDRLWSGRDEVERETAEWVRWLNADRLHSSIDYLSPIEYETRYREQCPIAPRSSLNVHLFTSRKRLCCMGLQIQLEVSATPTTMPSRSRRSDCSRRKQFPRAGPFCRARSRRSMTSNSWAMAWVDWFNTRRL